MTTRANARDRDGQRSNEPRPDRQTGRTGEGARRVHLQLGTIWHEFCSTGNIHACRSFSPGHRAPSPVKIARG